jgi:membrane associated rhomboid family serine protease
MPFLVYGRDARTGVRARRVSTRAQTAVDARREAESHGMRVSTVIPCTRRTAADSFGSHGHSAAASSELSRENAAFNRQLHEITPRAGMTYGLIAANLAVFASMVFCGVSSAHPKSADVIRWGADFGPKSLGREPWRLVSSMFVHFGFTHLASNMAVFCYVGPLVERMLGSIGFFATYLVAGVAGALVAVAMHPISVEAGASGAVFGIYGALIAILVIERKSVPPEVRTNLLGYALVFVAFNLLHSLRPEISMAAHVGGLIGGFACGLALARPLSRTSLPGRIARDAILAAGSGVVLAMGLFAARALHPNLVAVDAAIQRFTTAQIEIPEAIAKLASEAKSSGAASDAGGAIGRDYLPRWHSVLSYVESTKPVPSSLRPHIDGIVRYMRQREENWRDLATALLADDELLREKAERRMSSLDDDARKIRRSAPLHEPFD